MIGLLAKRLLAKRSEAKRVKRGCLFFTKFLVGLLAGPAVHLVKKRQKDTAMHWEKTKTTKRGWDWYEILGGPTGWASCAFGKEEAKRYSDALGKDKDHAKMIGLLAKRLLAKRSEAKRVKRGCDWYE